MRIKINPENSGLTPIFRQNPLMAFFTPKISKATLRSMDLKRRDTNRANV